MIGKKLNLSEQNDSELTRTNRRSNFKQSDGFKRRAAVSMTGDNQ